MLQRVKPESLNDLGIWSACVLMTRHLEISMAFANKKSLNSVAMAPWKVTHREQRKKTSFYRICAFERKCFSRSIRKKRKKGKSLQKKLENKALI